MEAYMASGSIHTMHAPTALLFLSMPHDYIVIGPSPQSQEELMDEIFAYQ
jgi:hypothetical protein